MKFTNINRIYYRSIRSVGFTKKSYYENENPHHCDSNLSPITTIHVVHDLEMIVLIVFDTEIIPKKIVPVPLIEGKFFTGIEVLEATLAFIMHHRIVLVKIPYPPSPSLIETESSNPNNPI